MQPFMNELSPLTQFMHESLGEVRIVCVDTCLPNPEKNQANLLCVVIWAQAGPYFPKERRFTQAFGDFIYTHVDLYDASCTQMYGLA